MKADIITVLNIDGVPYAVEGLSETIKNHIADYNRWSVKEADYASDFAMAQAAKRELMRTIAAVVKEELAAAKIAAAARAAAAEKAPEATADATTS